MNLHEHYPNVVEVAFPIEPGCTLGDRRVFEVRRLRSTLTLAGKPRPLFVAVREKDGEGSMLVMFVCLHGAQKEWAA